MKKILSLIFIGTVIAFTGCAEESNISESSSVNETVMTEGTTENMTENETYINISDKDYLVNLGKQLELGMPYEEMINKISKPDKYGEASSYITVEYHKGKFSLVIEIEYDPLNVADSCIVGDTYVRHSDSEEKIIIFSTEYKTKISIPRR